MTMSTSYLSARRSDEHAALQLAMSSRKLSDEILFLPWAVMATGKILCIFLVTLDPDISVLQKRHFLGSSNTYSLKIDFSPWYINNPAGAVMSENKE